MRAALFILFVLHSVILSAQYGAVQGTLTHARTKEPILFATIVFEDSIKRGTTTNVDGKFYLDSIPPGIYSVRVRAVGEGDSTFRNIKVYADSVISLQLMLPGPCEYDAHATDKRCPKCNRRKHVQQIVYGLVIGEMNTKKYYYAGCGITYCDPHWYCTKCELKF